MQLCKNVENTEVKCVFLWPAGAVYGFSMATKFSKPHSHHGRRKSFPRAWSISGFFPGCGQKNFIHGGSAEVNFHFTHSELREKHFSTKKLIRKISKSRGPASPLFRRSWLLSITVAAACHRLNCGSIRDISSDKKFIHSPLCCKTSMQSYWGHGLQAQQS